MVNVAFESTSPNIQIHPEVVMADQSVGNSKLANFVVKGTPVITAAAIACGCAYVGLNNPESKAVLPACGFYALTGYYCPGCGMTRALHSVLHGDILRAIKFNAILVIALPVFAYFYILWMNWAFTGRKLPTFTVSRRVSWTIVAIAAIFVVGRNFPGQIPSFFALGRV